MPFLGEVCPTVNAFPAVHGDPGSVSHPPCFPGWPWAGWHSIRTQSDNRLLRAVLPDIREEEAGGRRPMGTSWWLKARPASKPQAQKVVPMQTREDGRPCACQACAIQERALCGCWSTEPSVRSSLSGTGTRWAKSPKRLTVSDPSLCIFSDDSFSLCVSWLFCQSLPLLSYAWLLPVLRQGCPVSICLSI